MPGTRLLVTSISAILPIPPREQTFEIGSVAIAAVRPPGHLRSAAGKWIMVGLLRKAVGLIAAYAIALQAFLPGMPMAADGNPDPFSIVCTGDNLGHPANPLPRHNGHDCGACILACGGHASAVAPSSATILPVAFYVLAEQLPLWCEALPSPSRHQPQASRAPPSFA
jgi:hypothetical protein